MTKPRRKTLTIALSVLGVLVAAGALTSVASLKSYKMPSGSMIPGFPVGTHVFISKLDRDPVPGAVLVFAFPENPAQDFVKRVVALPGDEVSMTDKGHVLIGGQPIPDCKVGMWSYLEEDMGSGPVKHEGELYVEFLGPTAFLTFYDAASGGFVVPGPWKVQPGQFWVMGDNRNNSHDSRMWFGGAGGGVPNGNVHGRVLGHSALPTLPEGAASLQPALDACLKSHAAK